MTVMNSLFSCPHCNHIIHFPNEVSNHLVCICGNVAYKEHNSSPIKKFVPVIMRSGDLVQPGTEGEWKGNKFVVSGRFRAWFEENVFNYWTINFGNDKLYYLAEGYGLYSIYEALPLQDELKSADLTVFKLNSILDLKGTGKYRFLRKNNGHYLDVEGSFYKKDSNVLKTFEGVSDEGNLIAIFEFGDNIIDTYSVYPVDIETLKLTSLREVNYPGKKFICTECNHENTVMNYPYAQSWGCENCKAVFNLVNTEQVKMVDRVTQVIGMNISLGKILTLSGTTYTVVGFVCKEDPNGRYGRWQEYTLYNQQKGYAFLNESDGHWILLKETLLAPSIENLKRQVFCYEDKTFRLYSKYNYNIIYAVGEFPGNIFNDSQTKYAYDFICPPEMWSAEQNNDEGLTWFHGSHVNRKILKKQTGGRLPIKIGTGMLQPGASVEIPVLVRTTLVLLLAVICIHVFFGMASNKKVLLDQEFSMNDTVNAQTFMTDRFELKKWKSNLELELYAPVDNSWFEVGATLVNVATGDEYSIQQGVEYYHGYTDGENWSEGDQYETAYLDRIPSGTYFLKIDGIRDAGVIGYEKVSSFHVKVIYDVPMFRNLVLTILTLLLYPVIVVWTSNTVERGRWFGSPYSRYNYNN